MGLERIAIRVKLFAMLAQRLPADSRDHTLPLTLPAGSTPQDVLEQLQIPHELACLLMIDGVHLTRAEVRERPLRDGETLAIFPPIAGG